MPYTTEKKDNKVTFTITIPADEVDAGMRQAATRISESTKIPGFRPGKADYETIKQRVGEMKILEEATEGLIRSAFIKAMLEENLETVGQPYFNMVKTAPGNEMVFSAEVSLMPKIKKLADYSKASVKKNDTTPKQELIDQAKKDITTMQTKETRAPKGNELKKGDKAVVNLEMNKDNVPVEGGQGQNHGIYTAETYFIEGFIDKILGMKEDETRTFKLNFPKDHYQKHLAGQEVEFTVELKEIFELDTPKLDDAFAKTLGMKDLVDLELKLKENLQRENEIEEARRQEREILELLAKKTDFEEIPDLLVNQEIEKMMYEMQHHIKQRGMEFEDYLKSINKTLADLKLEMSEGALTRVKIAILLKEIAKQEQIKIDAKEIDKELDHIASHYEDKEQKKQIYSPQYREYVEHQMRNQKVIEALKEKIVK